MYINGKKMASIYPRTPLDQTLDEIQSKFDENRQQDVILQAEDTRRECYVTNSMLVTSASGILYLTSYYLPSSLEVSLSCFVSVVTFASLTYDHYKIVRC